MFRFKQFTIHQDRCAMKVCTDACLFGAWVNHLLRNEYNAYQTLLDIGAGTGLLSLMAAQETSLMIDAVETDPDAAQQATENAQASPFADRIRIYHSDIRVLPVASSYDCIISNPPFFAHSLKSPNTKRNRAMHSEDLSLEELFVSVIKRLKAGGSFGVLLPYYRKQDCIHIAQGHGLHAQRIVDVKQTPKHDYFRSMFWFGREEYEVINSSIVIKDGEQYTDEFSGLLRAYYLYL